MSPELTALLEKAKNHVMTSEEKKAQRRSFMIGMLPMSVPYEDAVKRVDEFLKREGLA